MKVVTSTPVDTAHSVEKANSPNPKQTKQPSDSGALSRSASSEVNISEDAQLLKKGVESVRALSELRQEKVVALKDRIKEGTYYVSSAQIADRLVDEHLKTDFGKNNF